MSKDKDKDKNKKSHSFAISVYGDNVPSPGVLAATGTIEHDDDKLDAFWDRVRAIGRHATASKKELRKKGCTSKAWK